MGKRVKISLKMVKMVKIDSSAGLSSYPAHNPAQPPSTDRREQYAAYFIWRILRILSGNFVMTGTGPAVGVAGRTVDNPLEELSSVSKLMLLMHRPPNVSSRPPNVSLSLLIRGAKLAKLMLLTCVHKLST